MTKLMLTHWFFALLLCAGPMWALSPHAGLVMVGLITFAMDHIYLSRRPILSWIGLAILGWCVVTYPLVAFAMWFQWIERTLG